VKEKYNIGEVSEIFKVPKSTLRYWDAESLIQMDRNQVNDYREYSIKQILEISDIAFYRSLNIPISKLRKIFEVTLDEFDDILCDTQNDLDTQIAKLEEIKQGIRMRRNNIKEVSLLQAAPYSKCKPDFQRMVEFEMSHFHKKNPNDFAILMNINENSEIQFGSIASEEDKNTDIIWEFGESKNNFIACILKVSVDNPEENNLKEHLNYINSKGYRAEKIVGRYLVTATEELRYDYYKIWMEVLKFRLNIS
jgi:DNA-binding transcriptional MerR regulator